MVIAFLLITKCNILIADWQIADFVVQTICSYVMLSVSKHGALACASTFETLRMTRAQALKLAWNFFWYPHYRALVTRDYWIYRL